MKLIIVFFFTTLLSAQVKSGEIEYKIYMSEENKSLSNDIKELNKLAVEGSKNITFTLNFSDNKAEFKKNDVLGSDNNSSNLASTLSGFFGDIYIDFIEERYYESHNDVLGNYIIKKKLKKFDWKLTTETKTIEGFRCYKATADEVVVNSRGTFTYPLTAWYCPSIPINSGPLGISGLPGLILEFSRKNVVFGAKKIVINPEKSPTILKPKLDNLKTEEEIKKMREDFMDSKD